MGQIWLDAIHLTLQTEGKKAKVPFALNPKAGIVLIINRSTISQNLILLAPGQWETLCPRQTVPYMRVGRLVSKRECFSISVSPSRACPRHSRRSRALHVQGHAAVQGPPPDFDPRQTILLNSERIVREHYTQLSDLADKGKNTQHTIAYMQRQHLECHRDCFQCSCRNTHGRAEAGRLRRET